MSETVNTTYYTLHKEQYEEYSRLAKQSQVSLDYFLLEFCELKTVTVD